MLMMRKINDFTICVGSYGNLYLHLLFVLTLTTKMMIRHHQKIEPVQSLLSHTSIILICAIWFYNYIMYMY